MESILVRCCVEGGRFTCAVDDTRTGPHARTTSCTACRVAPLRLSLRKPRATEGERDPALRSSGCWGIDPCGVLDELQRCTTQRIWERREVATCNDPMANNRRECSIRSADRTCRTPTCRNVAEGSALARTPQVWRERSDFATISFAPEADRGALPTTRPLVGGPPMLEWQHHNFRVMKSVWT